MFMQSSVQDTDGGDVEHAKAEITKRVVDNLSDYLHSATNAWDPQTLANENYKGVTPLNYPSPNANTDLSVLMSAYASRYLMAEQLLLLSSYYGNRVSKCLSVLNKYSPEKVIKNLPNVASNTQQLLDDSGHLSGALAESLSDGRLSDSLLSGGATLGHRARLLT
jgi:putative transposase